MSGPRFAAPPAIRLEVRVASAERRRGLRLAQGITDCTRTTPMLASVSLPQGTSPLWVAAASLRAPHGPTLRRARSRVCGQLAFFVPRVRCVPWAP